MKTHFTSLRRLALAGVTTLLLAASAHHAQAMFTFTLTQTAGNVVVTGSGTLNTTSLSLSNNGTATGQINPSFADLYAGPASSRVSQYAGGGLTGPIAFGPGSNYVSASSGTGNIVGVYGSSPVIIVPQSYVSGAQLTDNATFTGQTFATLGFTPGTYTYTWGTGANADSLIVTSGVPEPSTWASVAAGAGLLGVTLRRRRARMGC